jgi:anaerobic selenocysteine-containing dehydrogenase
MATRSVCRTPSAPDLVQPPHMPARRADPDAPRGDPHGAPYEAKAVFLYRANPVFSKPGGTRWVAALQAVPLVVSFSPLPDESTLWADYVLPDPTYLERWELVEPLPGDASLVLGLRQPVVEPVHRAQTGMRDLACEGARRTGRRRLPWPDYRAAVMQRMEGV